MMVEWTNDENDNTNNQNNGLFKVILDDKI